MQYLKITLIILICLKGFNSYSQTKDRIKEIESIYDNFNKRKPESRIEIKNPDTGGGGSNWMTIYSEFSGIKVIKMGGGEEFGSESTECYFENDTIAFMFYKSQRLLSHWSTDTVRFEKLEVKLYFEKGEIIKAIKKKFNGIEGKDDDFNMNLLQNINVDYKSDSEVNWWYLNDKLKDLIKLYYILMEKL
jgi:hypothetical protein